MKKKESFFLAKLICAMRFGRDIPQHYYYFIVLGQIQQIFSTSFRAMREMVMQRSQSIMALLQSLKDYKVLRPAERLPAASNRLLSVRSYYLFRLCSQIATYDSQLHSSHKCTASSYNGRHSH